MASKFIPPDLSNATPEMLVDDMGKLSVMENYIKKQREFLKKAYYARMGIDVEQFKVEQVVTQNGDVLFIASTTRSDPQRIDLNILKADYPDIAEECLRSKPQLTTRFNLKEGVNNPVVNDLLLQMKQELDLD